MTKFGFWQARLDAKDGWFDATKTWTAQQRESETCRLWAEFRARCRGVRRLVDFGAGLQRFKPHALAAGLEYLAVDVLPALVGAPDRKASFHLFDGKTPIPVEIDGDAALFCLVLQHLDDTDAHLALSATRAKTLMLVEGAWKSDGYTVARERNAYDLLLRDAGCLGWMHEVFKTPLVNYKIIVGMRT